MNEYCTYFDHRYLVRGLALHQSLVEHCTPFRLWILCLSDTCFDVLVKMNLPHVRLLRLNDLETADPELAQARLNRALVEYYFTCTPALLLHLLRTQEDVARLTYLDADLYFFGDPEPVFDEIGDHSIAMVPHRYSPQLMHMARSHGTYNVGWLSFRRDEHGLSCLAWWRERCIEWCYERVEDGKYADQKYLDEWPSRYHGVRSIQHPGANLAPWNLETHHLSLDGGRVLVDGWPLLFFHFHRLREIQSWLFAPRLADFKVTPSPIVRQGIYIPYLRRLRATHGLVKRLAPDVKMLDRLRGESTGARHEAVVPRMPLLAETGTRLFEASRRMLNGEYFVFVRDRVL